MVAEWDECEFMFTNIRLHMVTCIRKRNEGNEWEQNVKKHIRDIDRDFLTEFQAKNEGSKNT